MPSPIDTRHRILDAALSVVVRRGFDRATVDDVAESAGVSKGAVYHHYKSKEDLLTAVISTASNSLAEAVDEAASSHDDPIERIGAIVRAALSFFLTDERRVRVLLVEAVGLPPDAGLRAQARRSRVRESLEESAREARAAGLIDEVDPETAALALQGALHEVIRELVRDRTWSRPDASQKLTALLVQALAPKRP